MQEDISSGCIPGNRIAGNRAYLESVSADDAKHFFKGIFIRLYIHQQHRMVLVASHSYHLVCLVFLIWAHSGFNWYFVDHQPGRALFHGHCISSSGVPVWVTCSILMNFSFSSLFLVLICREVIFICWIWTLCLSVLQVFFLSLNSGFWLV